MPGWCSSPYICSALTTFPQVPDKLPVGVVGIFRPVIEKPLQGRLGLFGDAGQRGEAVWRISSMRKWKKGVLLRALEIHVEGREPVFVVLQTPEMLVQLV